MTEGLGARRLLTMLILVFRMGMGFAVAVLGRRFVLLGAYTWEDLAQLRLGHRTKALCFCLS